MLMDVNDWLEWNVAHLLARVHGMEKYNIKVIVKTIYIKI